MNYYKKNIGDYAKKAGKLSLLEHGVYNVLIDACYDREEFPTEQEAIEWSWARTDDEITAVKFVLKRFFKLVDGKYIQNRIQEEIEAYHETCVSNSITANNRQRSDNGTFTARPRLVDKITTDRPNNDHLTNNQEPLTNNQEPENTLSRTDVRSDGLKKLFEKFWEAYPKKKSKGDAEKAFRALKPRPCEQLVATMIATIERAKTSEQWAKDGGQFIPYPATWLRAKGWLDEATAPVKSAGDLWLEQKLAEKKSAQIGGAT